MTALRTVTRHGRFGRMDDMALRAKPNESLTLDEMRASLPAIFAEGPHESRSKRYVYISTADMLGELMKRDFVPVEARVSRSRIEGKQGFAKHLVRLRPRADIESPSTARRVGDTSFEVIMRNAHDGTASYQFMAGLLKLLCLNGMVASEGTVGDVKVYHTGNRQRQIDQVIEGAYTVLDTGAPKLLEKVEAWQGIDLLPDERMAFAEAARTVRFGDAEGKVETPITAQQLLNPRRPGDVGNNLWTTFNVIQENTLRGGLSAMGRDANGRPRRATTREVRGIDGDVKLNRSLWALAEKMAELKAG